MAKAQAQEPSMEEILASIRRIIADEDTAPAAKAAAPVPPAPAARPAPVTTVSEDELDKLFNASDDEDDVLDLGAEDVAPPAPMPVAALDDDLSFEPIAAKPDPVVVPMPAAKPEPVRMAAPEPAPAVKPAPRREPPPMQEEPEFRRDPLLSATTDTMVSAAFDNLALTILNKNARTVEDLIVDMMRPMLKNWLDQNLPTMVERLVRAEIERVARGRAG